MNKKCQIAFLGSDEIALPFLKLFEDLFRVVAFVQFLLNRTALRER